ncbi:MAG: putative sulfate exporter family transporter [Fusobacterium sp.]|nr:putative sulfate exporter family transporter [Fusobacterium sp.]
MKKIKDILPGLILAFLVAAIAKFLESLLPIKFIGASVIALFIGMIINYSWQPVDIYQNGLKFSSKKVLKFAIIILGASLNIPIILQIGKLSLTVMIFTLLTCFGGGYFIGKLLGLNWKLSNLISAGTGICGGSAIAAVAPVIEVEDTDIAYAMSATFLFDIAMILLFPIMGRALTLSDIAYGLWTGTAVNDTSSVVATGYAFSEAAGDFATMVKLTRTLSIIPTVLIFSILNNYLKNKNLSIKNKSKVKKLKITSILPWFILGFLFLSFVNSIGLISKEISLYLKELSKFLMITALAAIGLNTSFKQMKKSGLKPMIHGFIISTLVVIVALVVEILIGLV